MHASSSYCYYIMLLVYVVFGLIWIKVELSDAKITMVE